MGNMATQHTVCRVLERRYWNISVVHYLWRVTRLRGRGTIMFVASCTCLFASAMACRGIVAHEHVLQLALCGGGGGCIYAVSAV